jgi:RNA polymerase sigma factor (sigma-70 family)
MQVECCTRPREFLASIVYAISIMGAIMVDQDMLMLVPGFLTRQDKAQAPLAERCACDAFLRECAPLIDRLVRRARAPSEAIDDSRQDVWVEVLAGLPEFCLDPDHGTLEAWIGSIVSRQAWRYVRRRSRHRERPLPGELAARIPDHELGPETELEQMQQHEQFCAHVTQFAGRLSQRDSSILTRRFIDLKTSAAIARELGVTPGCVRDFLHRVAPELRAFLRAGGLGVT